MDGETVYVGELVFAFPPVRVRGDGFEVSPAYPAADGAGFDDDSALEEEFAEFGLGAGDVAVQEFFPAGFADVGYWVDHAAFWAYRRELGGWYGGGDVRAAFGWAFAYDHFVFERVVEELFCGSA